MTDLTSDHATSSLSPNRLILQTEGIAIAALCAWAFAMLGGNWWLFALLFLVPDVFMLGYLASTRVGAACYNLGHTYLTPAALGILGYVTELQTMVLVALIWGAHIGADRFIGYGLKYATGFKQNHLDRI